MKQQTGSKLGKEYIKAIAIYIVIVYSYIYCQTCTQVKRQQLELDMEQWTSSELGKEYVKAVYRHPAYLIYM